MIAVRVEVRGLDAVKAHLTGYAKQVTFATAKALTDVAGAIKQEIPGALERSLDRPTDFTKRGVFIRPARRDHLEAVVGFMQRQAAYLHYQIEGGKRSPTRAALRLPSNIPLDAQGNLPPRTIARLVEAARAGRFGKTVQRRLGLDAGGKSAGRRKRSAGAGPSLFYGQPRGLPGWPVGIYRRVPGKPGKLVPIIVFPRRQASYRRRFDFYGLAGRIIETQWPIKFRQALDYALATARPA